MTVKTEKCSLLVEMLQQVFTYLSRCGGKPTASCSSCCSCSWWINFVDMLNLKSLDMREGRIVFNRCKTARHHSMKAEPEVFALIEKYVGKAPRFSSWTVGRCGISVRPTTHCARQAIRSVANLRTRKRTFPSVPTSKPTGRATCGRL